MYEDLKIILYPDPRLKKASAEVGESQGGLKELAEKMLALMREHRGVGLAAPQVGLNIRMFVMNATGEPGGDQIYINPQLSEAEGSEEAEEGCLSLPGVNANIIRDKLVKLRARDLAGKIVEREANGFVARVWQHEFDHLNGVLIIDRMGSVAKMAHRKTLKELEEKYEEQHPPKKGKRS